MFSMSSLCADPPTGVCWIVLCSASKNSIADAACEAMQGANVISLLRELGSQFHAILLRHLQKFKFNTLGALRLKRDLTEYSEAVERFDHKSPKLRARYNALCALSNLFIVAPARWGHPTLNLFLTTPCVV